MAEEPINLSEILIGPLREMVKQIGSAVAAAQTSLDEAALKSQENLPKELREIGYQVTWYQMPDVTVELKVAVHYEKTPSGGPLPRILLAPFNAKYQNAFTYSADGASTLRLRIVPVPPSYVRSPPEQTP